MALNDVWEVQVISSNSQGYNRASLYYKQTSSGSADNQASDLAEAWVASVLPAWVAALTNQITVLQLYVRRVIGGYAVPSTYDLSTGNSGTEATDPLPANVCLALELHCVSPSHHNNGHIYISGVGENHIVDGLWSSTYLAGAADTLRSSLISTLAGGSVNGALYQAYTVSRYEGGVKRVPPVSFFVDQIIVRPRPASLRRRNVKV